MPSGFRAQTASPRRPGMWGRNLLLFLVGWFKMGDRNITGGRVCRPCLCDEQILLHTTVFGCTVCFIGHYTVAPHPLQTDAVKWGCVLYLGFMQAVLGCALNAAFSACFLLPAGPFTGPLAGRKKAVLWRSPVPAG